MKCTRTILTLTALAALGLAALPAEAQTYTLNTIASFNGSGDGASPFGALTLSGSTLYGTTEFGGSSSDDGTVFSVPVTGGTPTTLATFTGTNGANPEAGLTLSGTTLYGTTFGDDVNNDGTVFSLNTVSKTLTTLATFTGSNGSGPTSSLTLSANGSTLYGTTQDGGTSGEGVVFSVPVAGGTPTPLVNFPSGTGETPNSGLTLSANGSTLYGTTFYGGSSGDGTVYSVPVGGGTPAPLVNFTGTGTNGANPYAGLTLVGSTFYGTTEFGGSGGDGTVFSVPVAGGTPATLVSFTGPSVAHPDNGAYPLAGLIVSGTTLFGTTQDGGTSGDGTVFSWDTVTNTLTTLVSFNSANGATPLAGLTLGANGVLYGTTSGGGDANGDGTVFSLTPTAAPEPSQWAVLSLIALGLGALLRRARRQAP